MSTFLNVRDSLDEMTYEEIDAFMGEVKEYVKERKAEAKTLTVEYAKGALQPGMHVRFLYKGEESSGEVVKLNEKSFTVAFDEGGLKRPIQYQLYLGSADEAEEAA